MQGMKNQCNRPDCTQHAPLLQIFTWEGNCALDTSLLLLFALIVFEPLQVFSRFEGHHLKMIGIEHAL